MAKGAALARWQAHATLWGAMAALVVHVSLGLVLARGISRGAATRPPVAMEIEVSEPKVTPPPPAPPVEQPAPEPRPALHRPLAKQPTLPRPNRETPPPLPSAPAATPVFGVTPETVTQGESTVAVPVGNTLMTKDRTPAKAPPAPLPPAPDPNAFTPLEDNLICHPATIASEIKAEYPPEALRLGIEGRVILRVAVDRQGNVRWTKIIRPAGHGLDEAARQALARFKFQPARACDGRIVDQVITYTYTFQTET